MRKEKADQNAVAELTREGLYKENKWLWEENRKLKEEINTLRIELIQEKGKTGKKWTPATPYI